MIPENALNLSFKIKAMLTIYEYLIATFFPDFIAW